MWMDTWPLRGDISGMNQLQLFPPLCLSAPDQISERERDSLSVGMSGCEQGRTGLLIDTLTGTAYSRRSACWVVKPVEVLCGPCGLVVDSVCYHLHSHPPGTQGYCFTCSQGSFLHLSSRGLELMWIYLLSPNDITLEAKSDGCDSFSCQERP